VSQPCIPSNPCDDGPVGAPSASSGARSASRRIADGARLVAGAEPSARTSKVLVAGVATAFVGLLLLLPIGATLQVVLSSHVDDRTPTQAIVVLDPAQYWGNTRPVLRARLEHAAQLYREGVAPVVIVTGPQRRAGDERRILVEQGVADRDIVSFDTGADTVGSLRVVAGVMRDLGWSSATVVTDPAQAARAGATSSALGIDAHLSPTADGPGAALTSEQVAREVAALVRHHLLTRWSLRPVIDAPA
jgi:uncharacterized SAM-binding protein YcdF (DUF218 family)